ncbi:aminotransferase-like domain-containing protein [Duganella lactea]|nr:PLP-dependent aminotransferase family protein [Duganella lactea]
MNYLNEIAGRYPNAVSLASGRPAGKFFQTSRWVQQMEHYVEYFAGRRGLQTEAALVLLAQYGATNGIINELIARQLDCDEQISCTPNQLMVTAGCQEAIDLCVGQLCTDARDVIIVQSPVYIGITGAANRHGVDLVALAGSEEQPLLSRLQETLRQLAAQGRRARAFYLVPNFDNPTGATLTQTVREALIDCCAAQQILILEDNPYGMFRYEGGAVPAMYTLDRSGCVLYLGTYSKTICPALRVGFLLLPPALFGSIAAAEALMTQLSQAKSFVTVNTSQLTQAIVGGVLLSQQGSLASLLRPVIDFYRHNRDAMVATLADHFTSQDGVQWNVPEGGFFLVVDLPFPFGQREAEICAGEYHVLVMPLSFFALDESQSRRVRLAFSNGDIAQIEEGVRRFSRFVRDRLGRN